MLYINFEKVKKKIYIFSYVITMRWTRYCRETSGSSLRLFEQNTTPYLN